MSKIIALVLVSLLALPIVASAQIKECCVMSRSVTIEGNTCDVGDIPAPDATAATDCGAAVDHCDVGDQWGMFCLINTIYRVTDWISYIIFAVVGIMIIVGAFSIVTAGGDPEKVTSGRNYILYAVIGLVVAFFAKAIPALVRAMVGM